MNKTHKYEYQAEVVKVVDGDTIDVLIRWDVGFHITCETYQRLRLARINAPEVRGSEREKGLKAKEWLEEALASARREILIRTSKDDSFGRWVAEVVCTYGDPSRSEKDITININDNLVKAGHAEYKEY